MPFNFTILSIDHKAPLSNPTYFGATTEDIFTSYFNSLLMSENLRVLLVRATLNDTRHEMPGLCGTPGFKTCLILTATNDLPAI